MNTKKEKACRKCLQVKPVEAFYENKYSPDGRYAFCKVCFDQFAEKLKEKELSAAPLNKTCVECGKLKLIDAFDNHPENSSIKDDWCSECRQKKTHSTNKKIKKAENSSPEGRQAQNVKPQNHLNQHINSDNSSKAELVSLQKTAQEPVVVSAEDLSHEKPQKPRQNSVQIQGPEQTEDFDFIEHLLENKALENQLAHEALRIPRQITKIRARQRICNGCGKTEEIDQAEKNTVLPVHAWFCDYCRQRGTKRRLRKRMTVQDYWGRDFKIKKIISDDLVMGVVKNQNGKWDKRLLKIYVNWKTS